MGQGKNGRGTGSPLLRDRGRTPEMRAWLRKLARLTAYLGMAAALAAPAPADSDSQKNLRVVVSIKPLHSLVAAVMENAGEPRLLITGADSPHGWNPKPSQIRDVLEADAVFYVSDELETFLAKDAFMSVDPDVRRIPVAHSTGVELLPGRHWDEHDEHEHDSHGSDGEHDEHDDHNGHEATDEHDNHHHHGIHDLHVWLDPANARKIVDAVARELAGLDPGNRKLYEENAGKAREKLDALDRRLHGELAPVRGKPYVVFHDAYQYFEGRYGLAPVGVVRPGGGATPRHIAHLREQIRHAGVKCVFREPQFPERLVRTVIEGTGAKEAVLDPLGVDLPAGPQQYHDLLSALSANLRTCLE